MIPLVHPNQIQKTELCKFWNRFGGRKNDGSAFDRKLKLQAVQEIADFLIVGFKKQQSLSVRRTNFIRVRNERLNLSTRRNKSCFICCRNKATCRHHLIQLQNGGINSKKNIIALCDGCHAAVHPWINET